MTKLTVSILVETVDVALAWAAIAAERGADMVEYRLDRFAEPPDRVADLVRRSPLPCIVTCRPTWEGGEFDGQEAHRLQLLRQAVCADAAYVDIELAAEARDPAARQWVNGFQSRPLQTRLVLSSHDFVGRPADLFQKLCAMAEHRAAHVIKIAWRARSLRDNLEAFELLRQRPRPMIALCMGEFGLPSRVLAKKFGALLTFAGLDDESVTAPGQVGVATMKDLYRWDGIDHDTAVYGVIGWPVGHSLSPHIHNAGFGAVGHNGVYLPLPIPPEYEHFKATVGAWLDDPHLHFRGASVTIPHKQNLLRFVAERGGTIEPLAQRIGAGNTLTVGRDGSLRASNTDYAAALDCMVAAIGGRGGALRGKHVAVVGAGGAARALVAGLAHEGALTTIYNRTVEKAQALAQELGTPVARVAAAPLDNLTVASFDILVNCTPIGMAPRVEASPVPGWPARLKPGTVVFDTIYNPAQTRLLRDAAEAGATTISGVEMFVRQASQQFQLWTGAAAPMELFRNIVCRRLGG